MKTVSQVSTLIIDYLQRSETITSPQLRRLGLIYSIYRLIVSVFFLLISYVSIKADSSVMLPSLLKQTALSFYFLLSFILLGLFYVVSKHQRRQLAFGLTVDVVILSLLLYISGAPDLQLTMLYMVVVATSFMLLQSSQALIITLLAIIFVIYQQFFYAIANSMSLSNVGDAVLMSVSFLAVGFLSWSLSQRLLHVEQMAQQQSDEVERLNTINQEVISQMINGVMVIDQQQVVLANTAAYQLLAITTVPSDAACISPKSHGTNRSSIKNLFKRQLIKNSTQLKLSTLLEHFESQLQLNHADLLQDCLSVNLGQSSHFIYELPTTASASVTDKLRIQVIPLKDASKLILLEDLSREQASAQQLKLASLGQLTASIAHEIRNPLAAISQASQLLIEEVAEYNAATEHVKGNGSDKTISASPINDNHELYQMIFMQTKRVNRIIEDVLKLSRQQPPIQQQIHLNEWMLEFLDNYFQNKNVYLQVSDDPSIRFDTHQLEQILINLINNGLRYSGRIQEQAHVDVEVYRAQNDVIIDILDDGAGVDDANLEQLFNPFFTTDQAGTGLGLYLSQAFSGANQARLIHVAALDRTCFRLIMPTVLHANNKIQ